MIPNATSGDASSVYFIFIPFDDSICDAITGISVILLLQACLIAAQQTTHYHLHLKS